MPPIPANYVADFVRAYFRLALDTNPSTKDWTLTVVGREADSSISVHIYAQKKEASLADPRHGYQLHISNVELERARWLPDFLSQRCWKVSYALIESINKHLLLREQQ